MKFAALFLLLAIGSITLAIDGVLPGLTVWLATSALVLASAYGFQKPWLICGKQRSGQLLPLLLIVNLPWLLFTWLIWLLIALINREPPLSHIPGTRLWISRYPLFGVDLHAFDQIFDLTAEFPALGRKATTHECLPNLDGVALTRWTPTQNVDANQRILVHCAQGHGRSATFSSVLLAELGLFSSPEAAYRAILDARPGARLSASQRAQIQKAS